MRAFQNLNQFREDSQFSTWLIRITVNQSLMKLRKQRAIRAVSLDEDFQTDRETLPMEVTDWAPNPEHLYLASELRDILTTILEELSPLLRTVFVLRDVEGPSIDETAEVLNLSHAAVKARLNKYFSKHTDISRAELLPLGRLTSSLLAACTDL